MKRIKSNIRIKDLIIQQEKLAKKIADIQIIIDLRQNNEMSLRKIGKQVGMSGQNVLNILKQFGLLTK